MPRVRAPRELPLLANHLQPDDESLRGTSYIYTSSAILERKRDGVGGSIKYAAETELPSVAEVSIDTDMC